MLIKQREVLFVFLGQGSPSTSTTVGIMFIQKYIFFAFRFDKCKYIGLVNSRYFYEKPIQKVNITFYPSDQTDHIYYCYIILSHTWKSHWHREENS